MYSVKLASVSKVCYLHVGLHKTASSSFQVTCAKNKDLLQKFGLTYPLFSCEAAKKFRLANHSYPMKSLYLENPADFSHNQRWGVANKIDEVNSSYESQFGHCLASSDNLIISGEEISKLKEQEISRLIEKIQAYDYRLEVIALVRSPYSAICSSIQQVIKGGRYIELLSLNDRIPSSDSVVRFSRLIARFSKIKILKNLRSVFGDSLKLHSFDDACANPYGPVGFLLEEFLGQDPSAFEYVRSNESMSNLSVRIANEFNKLNPAFIDGKYNDKFQGFPMSVDKQFEFSGKFFLTELEYSTIKAQVDREVEELDTKFGLDFSGSQLRFVPPIF